MEEYNVVAGAITYLVIIEGNNIFIRDARYTQKDPEIVVGIGVKTKKGIIVRKRSLKKALRSGSITRNNLCIVFTKKELVEDIQELGDGFIGFDDSELRNKLGWTQNVTEISRVERKEKEKPKKKFLGLFG